LSSMWCSVMATPVLSVRRMPPASALPTTETPTVCVIHGVRGWEPGHSAVSEMSELVLDSSTGVSIVE
jgi:hypothetical protein